MTTPKTPEGAGWFLPYAKVSHLTSLPDMLAHAKRAHYTNAIVRKDGKETVYEADWIKFLEWKDAAPSAEGVGSDKPKPVAFHDKDQPEGIAWCPGYPEGLKDITALYAAPTAPAGGEAPDADQRDAGRYRFLRGCRGQEHDPLFTVQHELDGILWGGDLDAAIDVARADDVQASDGGKA